MLGEGRLRVTTELVHALETKAPQIYGQGRFFRSWLVRCSVAEFLGIGLAALVGSLWFTYFGEPVSLSPRLLIYVSFLAVGAVEGMLIGLAQATLLKRILPSLHVARFTAWTVLIAVFAWAMGMMPSTFFSSVPPAGASEEPSMWVVLGFSCLGGAIGGLLIGSAQALELRHHTRSVRPWIFATIIGWGLSLPLDMLGATLPDANTPTWLVILSAASFGLLAGAVFALPTGIVAWHFQTRKIRGVL